MDNEEQYGIGIEIDHRVDDYSRSSMREHDESDELDLAFTESPHEIRILIEAGDYIDHNKRASKEFGISQYEI